MREALQGTYRVEGKKGESPGVRGGDGEGTGKRIEKGSKRERGLTPGRGPLPTGPFYPCPDGTFFGPGRPSSRRMFRRDFRPFAASFMSTPECRRFLLGYRDARKSRRDALSLRFDIGDAIHARHPALGRIARRNRARQTRGKNHAGISLARTVKTAVRSPRRSCHGV